MEKKIFTLIVFLAGVITLTAQKTVYYPIVDSKSDSNFEIKSIYSDNFETTVTFLLECKSQLLYMSFKPEKTFIKMSNRNLAYIRSNQITIGYQTIRRGDNFEFSITFKGAVPSNGAPFNVIIGDAFEDTEFDDVRFETNSLGELRRKVDLGDKNAQNDLALMYYNGNQVAVDYYKALELFKKAADSGLLVAYGNAGSLHLWGKVADASVTKARQWFEEGDRLGDAHSQYYLATMYRDGNGVLKNRQKAKVLFEKGANAGNQNAQYELAVMYKADNQLSEAFKLFRKSAEDNKDAQYELGIMYYYAKGTSKDTQQAAYWIKKAYENGNNEAKKVWDGLELWKYDKSVLDKKDNIIFISPQMVEELNSDGIDINTLKPHKIRE